MTQNTAEQIQTPVEYFLPIKNQTGVQFKIDKKKPTESKYAKMHELIHRNMQLREIFKSKELDSKKNQNPYTN
jgi:hypothetical protein